VDSLKAVEQTTAPPKLSAFAKVMIALVVVLAVLFAFPIYKAVQEVDNTAKRAKTSALLMACRSACQMFYTNVNRWPFGLAELTTHTNGPFIYMGKNPGFFG